MRFFLTISFSLANLFSLIAQDIINEKTDSTGSLPIKKDFALGGMPISAFDADIGLRYGLILNLFDYGNGEYFPQYKQYAYIKAFRSTKGTSSLSMLYDSERRFQNVKVIAEATYKKDIALDFFGYNGINSNVDRSLITPSSANYINKYFYTQRREFFRLKSSFQWKIKNSYTSFYLAGSYTSYNYSPVDYNKFNIPETSSGTPAENVSLYEKYMQWGILNTSSKPWENSLNVFTGLVIDTRNSKLNCSDGIWLETFLLASQGLNHSAQYLKHIFTYRQYVHLHKINAILFYRLSSQQKITGTIPYAALPFYHNTKYSQDGLGGAFTLRGIARNRIVADGFLLSNIELRKRVLKLHALFLDWQVDISGFVDAAYITQEYAVNLGNVPTTEQIHFKNEKQKINGSYGTGIYFIYNENNIITINYGFAMNKNLGQKGLYIGSEFLF